MVDFKQKTIISMFDRIVKRNADYASTLEQIKALSILADIKNSVNDNYRLASHFILRSNGEHLLKTIIPSARKVGQEKHDEEMTELNELMKLCQEKELS